jgi:mannose-6-phosphate isomerase-like protein (cupin superfamily)
LLSRCGLSGTFAAQPRGGITSCCEEEAAMSSQTLYSIHLDARYAPLELIDIQALVSACNDPWYNQTLCRVNDCVVRLGVMQGEFHWHKRDNEDEFFYVVDGRFEIDLEGRTVALAPRQGFTVPKGVMHRTRAPERTGILMIEGAGVMPTGD